MKSLELAKQMLEEAGYKVTPPEEKFIPYKGQLVEATNDSDWYVTYFVSFDTRERPMCSSLTDLLYADAWNNIRPLSNPLIKQFKPWSERGDYNGPANVLFDSGEIGVFDPMSIAEQPHNTSNFGGKPIAFEPLESKE